MTQAPSKRSSVCRVTFLPDARDHNPYQSLLTAGLGPHNVEVDYVPTGVRSLLWFALTTKSDIVHVHWPDPYIFVRSGGLSFLKMASALLSFVILRLRGRPLVYTLHNLRNHERKHRITERCFYLGFVRLVDCLIAHCDYAKKRVAEMYGDFLIRKTVVIPHGNYQTAYAHKLTRSDARQQLSIPSDALVFLFLGLIRPYKGILDLMDAFADVDRTQPARLIVAGRIMDNAERLRATAAGDERVQLREGFVPDETMIELLSAADVFVAPFKQVLTSGSVILAMSYGLPCIAPRIGCLPETLASQPELLYDAEDPAGLRTALNRAVKNRAELAELGRTNEAYASSSLDWQTIGTQTWQAYLRVLP